MFKHSGYWANSKYAPSDAIALFKHHNLYLAGLEKSGAFVEHADEISEKLANRTVLILNNDYIYKYVLPGKADPTRPYLMSVLKR